MTRIEIVNNILYNWDSISDIEIIKLATQLPLKLVRWIASNHPDNKTRKTILQFTNVEIGIDTVVNQNIIISDNYKPLLKIGDRVAISPNVTFICASGPNNSLLNNNSYVSSKLICEKQIVIGNDVWIGANVTILPGVKIGNYSIIGAGSIVSKDLESNMIYAGFPLKKLRNLNESNQR